MAGVGGGVGGASQMDSYVNGPGVAEFISLANNSVRSKLAGKTLLE